MELQFLSSSCWPSIATPHSPPLQATRTTSLQQLMPSARTPKHRQPKTQTNTQPTSRGTYHPSAYKEVDAHYRDRSATKQAASTRAGLDHKLSRLPQAGSSKLATTPTERELAASPNRKYNAPAATYLSAGSSLQRSRRLWDYNTNWVCWITHVWMADSGKGNASFLSPTSSRASPRRQWKPCRSSSMLLPPCSTMPLLLQVEQQPIHPNSTHLTQGIVLTPPRRPNQGIAASSSSSMEHGQQQQHRSHPLHHQRESPLLDFFACVFLLPRMPSSMPVSDMLKWPPWTGFHFTFLFMFSASFPFWIHSWFHPTRQNRVTLLSCVHTECITMSKHCSKVHSYFWVLIYFYLAFQDCFMFVTVN